MRGDIIIHLAALIFIFCALYFLVKVRYCAKCHVKLPFFRRPHNFRQFLIGGWICPKCGSELDREGNLIENGKEKVKGKRKNKKI